MNPDPKNASSSLDRPVFALWIAAVSLGVAVATYLVGPAAIARADYLATLHVVAMSALAVVFFGYDKWRAGAAGRRVSEAGLLTLAWLGGAPGAAAGMTLLRHKTQKPGFKFGVPAALFVHVVVLGWLWIR